MFDLLWQRCVGVFVVGLSVGAPVLSAQAVGPGQNLDAVLASSKYRQCEPEKTLSFRPVVTGMFDGKRATFR